MAPMIQRLESRNFLSAVPSYDKVCWYWLENHSNAVAQMPYLKSIALKGAWYPKAKQVAGTSDPSLPEYLSGFFGDTFGIHDDKNYSSHKLDGKPNLFTEIVATGKTVEWYQGDKKSEDKHVPAKYSKDTQQYVTQKLPQSFSALKNLEGISPNKQANAHDGSLKQADDYLKGKFKWLFDGAFSHNTLVIVTFDEGQGSNSTIDTVLYGPGVKVGKYTDAINHYDEHKTIASIFGVNPIAKAASAKGIDAFASNPPPDTLPGGGGDDTGPGGGGGDTLPGDGGHRRGALA